jgi:hypothetical protein
VTSLYLLNDTGTAGDSVTCNATIAGTVSDQASSPEVQFDLNGDGIVDETIWPEPDGSFEFAPAISPSVGQNTYRARTLVYDGMAMPIYGEWVEVTFTYNPAPHIWSFEATEGQDGLWTFSGYVEDDNPGLLTITFGGLLEGQTVVVELDGSFTLSVVLDPEAYGLVTAQTTDEYGEVSNLAETWVSSY